MTTAAAARAATRIDREANSIMMTRTFAASREHIFEAWTNPEHITSWWDPTGARLAACEVDLRPGGRFRFVNQGTHGAPAFEGVYREISPPSRLAFEAMGSVGTVDLEDLGGRTLMTVTIRCASPEHLEQFVKMGVDVGTARTLDNLVAHVARLHP
jgi:uncharacterized protein YndB with AHSA1/START domain